MTFFVFNIVKLSSILAYNALSNCFSINSSLLLTAISRNWSLSLFLRITCKVADWSSTLLTAILESRRMLRSQIFHFFREMIEFFFLFINHSHTLWRSEAFVRWLVATFAWWTEKSSCLCWRHWFLGGLANIYWLIQKASLNVFCSFFGFLLTFHIPCDSALYVSINFLRALSDNILLGSSFLYVSDRLANDFSLLVLFENLIGYLRVLA
jgi:hypothetical protein